MTRLEVIHKPVPVSHMKLVAVSHIKPMAPGRKLVVIVARKFGAVDRKLRVVDRKVETSHKLGAGHKQAANHKPKVDHNLAVSHIPSTTHIIRATNHSQFTILGNLEVVQNNLANHHKKLLHLEKWEPEHSHLEQLIIATYWLSPYSWS